MNYPNFMCRLCSYSTRSPFANNYAVIHRVRTNPLPLRFAMTILGAGHIKMKIT